MKGEVRDFHRFFAKFRKFLQILSTRNNMRFPNKISIDHKDKIQLLTGKAGDVILFLSHNIHRGTKIKEDETIDFVSSIGW